MCFKINGYCSEFFEALWNVVKAAFFFNVIFKFTVLSDLCKLTMFLLC